MNEDGVFEDLGGSTEHSGVDAWDIGGAIYEACGECGAERDRRCVNPITGLERKSPCVSRTCGKKPANPEERR